MNYKRPVFPHPTLGKFIWHYRKWFYAGGFLAIMRSLVMAPFPFFIQIMIDEHVRSGDVLGIFSMSLLMVGLLALHYVFHVTGSNRLGLSVSRVIRELRGMVFHKLQFLHFGYLDSQKTGRLLSKYAFDTQKIEMVIMPLVNQLIPSTVYSLLVLFVLIFMNWQLTMVVLGFIPIYAFSRWYFFSRLKRKNRQMRLAQENLTGTANEYISALRLVRGYGEESKAIDNVEDSSDFFMRRKVEQVALNNSFGAFAFVAIQVLTLIVVAGGGGLVISGAMTIGTLFGFLSALPIIVQPVQQFLNFSQQFFVGKEGFYSLSELLNSTYVEDWKGEMQLENMRGEIEFKNVTFAYSDDGDPAVRSLDLHIKGGESVALVGSSGSGKSTVANLLLGLYKPQEGHITIDGVPQSRLDMRWLRQHSAIVMQESLLLSGTIFDNIRFARNDASDREVYEAARLANASEFIERMPEGYMTKVGERGAMLSGGQRQRLSIARAVLRDPRILILDEATSALDYESESLIQEALDRLASGRTVITIAHRLSTVKRADRIAVLSNGVVMEEGPYNYLAEHGTYFKELLAFAEE